MIHFLIALFCMLVLEPFFDAVQDTLETVISYNKSRFSKWKKEFWCKPISAHVINFLPGTRYRFDGWHGAKSCQIVSVAVGFLFMVLFKPDGYLMQLQEVFCGLHWLVKVLVFCLVLVVYGFIRNKVFSLFYEKIFPKPNDSAIT